MSHDGTVLGMERRIAELEREVVRLHEVGEQQAIRLASRFNREREAEEAHADALAEALRAIVRLDNDREIYVTESEGLPTLHHNESYDEEGEEGAHEPDCEGCRASRVLAAHAARRGGG